MLDSVNGAMSDGAPPAEGVTPAGDGPAPEQGADPEPEPSAVVVSFKKRPPVAIEIDQDLLTWDDLTEMMELQEKGERGELTQREQMDALAVLLTKVTGQDMHKLPARVVTALVAELGKLAGQQTEKQKN